MKARYFLLAVLWATGAVLPLAEEDESDHDHEHEHEEHGEHFEQAAVYNMTEGNNNLIVLPGDEHTEFEVDGIAFMVVPATSADEEGLEGAEEIAEEAWEAYEEDPTTATILSSGDTASPSNTTVYEVDLENPLVQVPVEITTAGAYALFVEHGSEEVSVVVTSPLGVVLTAGASEGVDEEEDDESSSATSTQWGSAIAATVIVSLCSLVGLVIVASGHVSRKINISYACMFAAGALLTASFLHIIPEALEGLADEFDNNLHDMGISAGVATLGGIAIGVLLHIIFETTEHPHADSTGPVNNKAHTTSSALTTSSITKQESSNPGGAEVPAQANTPQSLTDGSNDTANLYSMMEARKDKALLDVKGWHPGSWNIIIGDFVHNFADGVAIGAAFLGCSSTVGWIVTGSIVIHELPQELADFLALVNGGMSKMQAFFFNFLSAISAILGAVAILALRETLSSADVSYILFVGAGTFIFIALGELIPEGFKDTPSAAGAASSVWRMQIFKFLSFVIGAGIIGVSLIFDEHCDSGDHAHDH